MISKRLVFSVVAGLAITIAALPVFADGCFLCKDGGYVKYVGEDTFPLRHKARDQFKCEVSGTVSECSNPKGTVSKLETPTPSAHIATK